MPRPLRTDVSDATHHIAALAVERERVFREPADRRRLLTLLGAISDLYAWNCRAFCLMGTHFHLIVHTPEPTPFTRNAAPVWRLRAVVQLEVRSPGTSLRASLRLGAHRQRRASIRSPSLRRPQSRPGRPMRTAGVLAVGKLSLSFGFGRTTALSGCRRHPWLVRAPPGPGTNGLQPFRQRGRPRSRRRPTRSDNGSVTFTRVVCLGDSARTAGV